MSGEHRGVVLVGKYELHEELAAGGMATVFLGRNADAPGLGYYAIKRLHEHLARDEELVPLLLEEARITERIRHPNIVATVDVEALERELLLIMEYVHGETLSELLKICSRTKQRCPVPVAAAIFHGILLGLDAAHNATDAAGQPLCIVHRDVSPQNIIVGTDGVPRLLDFGIAKAIGSVTHTRTGELRGKVPYMAPEILRFDPATRQSDVWATAVVLWETLCARRLFKGESMTIWGQILTADLVAPGTVLGAPTPLDEVVMRGLARDRSARFATAAEMAAAIASAVPLASPSEVAAWVSSLAANALAHRVGVLQAIGARPPTARGAAARAIADELGSLGVATSTLKRNAGPASTRGSRRARVWMPWTLSFVLAAVVIALVARRLPRSERPAAASTVAASLAPATSSRGEGEPAASALVSMSDPSPATTPETPPIPLAPVSSTAPPTPTVAPTRPKMPGSPRHSSPRPVASPSVAFSAPKPPTTPPSPNCDPPFSIDEGGRKVYKLECVKGN